MKKGRNLQQCESNEQCMNGIDGHFFQFPSNQNEMMKIFALKETASIEQSAKANHSPTIPVYLLLNGDVK